MNVQRTSLGSLETAERIAHRAEEHVSAYRDFLSKQNWNSNVFTARPFMDKKTYLTAFPFDALLGDDFDQTFTIFKSSGSSGQGFYWPQLKQGHRSSIDLVRYYLEQTFAIHKKKTLAVVGLALGSWIGGEHFSWLLKSVALNVSYPFSVFSPGSCHDEIIEMTRRASRHVDQILLVSCPSAIGHLQLRAEQSQRPLPLEKMRYLVLGEPFPESLRISVQRQAGITATESVLYSVYGSADTGSLGAESPPSVALRRLFASNRELADRCGLPAGSAPHFFHCTAPDAYLETVDGELLVTRWQGVPLVRYNLHDAAQLFDWRALRAEILATPAADAEEAGYRAVLELAGESMPDLIAIAGRSDACLILCGTNLSETMLDAAVRSEALAPLLTGMYKARLAMENGRQRLEFDLELRTNVPAGRATEDTLYENLVRALGHEQPEFADDWKNVYSLWDDEPEKRILKLNCVAWPALSQRLEKEIKQRGTRA